MRALICGAACLAAAMFIDAGRSPAAAQPACSPGTAKIVAAYRATAPAAAEAKKPGEAQAARDAHVQLGDMAAIEVQNGQALSAEACHGKIVLFLNGVPLKGLATYPAAHAEPAVWTFVLQVSDASQEAWSTLLGRPDFGERSLAASLSLADQPPLPSEPGAVLQMKVLPTAAVAVWAGLFALMVVVFFGCAVKSDLLRNAAANAALPAGAKPAYSLSKVQGAWWFFVILACYLLIGIVTGNFSTSLNSTALILLGISAGTVLGSAAIDTSKTTPDRQQANLDAAAQAQEVAQQLQAAIARVETAQRIPGQAAQIPRSILTLPAQRQAAAAAAAEYSKLIGQSQHFITDVLSDANGVNFHRFQMAVWTIVLGVIFISDVYLTLAMPTFNTTLMGLMGLSAGTYLGLKIPEPPKGLG